MYSLWYIVCLVSVLSQFVTGMSSVPFEGFKALRDLSDSPLTSSVMSIAFHSM